MSTTPTPLIDVLSADSYAAEHIAGSVNICVYEVAFLDKVRQAFPDLAAPLTVYGLDDSTLEAGFASEQLRRAGYENVRVLPGGLAGWKAQGGAIETGPAAEKPVEQGRYAVDRSLSFAHWIGRNPFNHHTGSVAVSGGYIQWKDGYPVEGVVTLDLTALTCSDLADSTLNGLLIKHLQSEDFFETAKYPEAEFRITAVKALEPLTAGVPTHAFSGELTLRGMTQAVEFPALVAARPDGGYTAQALFSIDRTLWGVRYGSARFFARLGQHLVNDDIHLHLKIVTAATASA